MFYSTHGGGVEGPGDVPCDAYANDPETADPFSSSPTDVN